MPPATLSLAVSSPLSQLSQWDTLPGRVLIVRNHILVLAHERKIERGIAAGSEKPESTDLLADQVGDKTADQVFAAMQAWHTTVVAFIHKIVDGDPVLMPYRIPSYLWHDIPHAVRLLRRPAKLKRAGSGDIAWCVGGRQRGAAHPVVDDATTIQNRASRLQVERYLQGYCSHCNARCFTDIWAARETYCPGKCTGNGPGNAPGKQVRS